MSVEAMIIAVKRSFETLVAIVCFLVMIVIVSSTMVYYAERGEYDPLRKKFFDVDGLPSKFDSIPSSFWFVIEIVTTVGLGDVYPKTTLGRVITFPVMMFGLLIIALPSIVIGRNFADAWTWLRINRIGRRGSSPTLPSANSADEEVGHHPNKLAPSTTAAAAVAALQSSPIHRTVGSDDILVELLKEMKRQNALLERIFRSNQTEL